MNGYGFDALLRVLSGAPSRRAAVRMLVGSLVFSQLQPTVSPAQPKKSKGKGKGKKKKKQPAAIGCIPACGGKNCGNDGCGGHCGTCKGGFVCSNLANGGSCICPSGRETCVGGLRCCGECQ